MIRHVTCSSIDAPDPSSSQLLGQVVMLQLLESFAKVVLHVAHAMISITAMMQVIPTLHRVMFLGTAWHCGSLYLSIARPHQF